MEMPLYFQLLSALFSSLSHFFFRLEINKMYYIHIASMPGSFCCSSAFALFSSAGTRSDTGNVHRKVVRQVRCARLFWCACVARLESPLVGTEAGCISPVCGLVRSAEHLCCICNNPPVPSRLSPLCLLLFFFFFNVSLHTHTYINIYISLLCPEF